MDLPIKELLDGGGVLALAVVVWWELRSIRGVLDRMLERLARIDVRTADADAVPMAVHHDRSRRLRTSPTPFMDDDTPHRGNR